MSSVPSDSSDADTAEPYRRYLCIVCGLIYDEAEGWPDDGIAPGTRWSDVPLSWCCPDCGAVKDDFDMMEIS